MTPDHSAESSAAAKKARREKLTLGIIAALLIGGALCIVLFLTRIPLPFRLLMAFTDLVAAALILLALRQRLQDERRRAVSPPPGPP